tara:strand:+ start:458 stop:946 length:489 start_codon:yes stop_codon:yes gene_type:complete
MMIYLIAAISDDGIIGVNKLGVNKLPWKICSKWFQMHTMNGCVIMGRKTWESITPLENCMNIILTRGMLPINSDNEYWTNSLSDAFAVACLYKHTYIIGGSDVFHTVLLSGLVNGLIITRVHVNINHGKSLILPLQKKLLYKSKKQIENKISYHFEIFKLKT